MGQHTRSYEYSVQLSAFQIFQIQNGNLKTIFHYSSSTIHRAAETAVLQDFLKVNFLAQSKFQSESLVQTKQGKTLSKDIFLIGSNLSLVRRLCWQLVVRMFQKSYQRRAETDCKRFTALILTAVLFYCLTRKKIVLNS